ncbi:related to Y.lipolytica glyoxylate pathway regulator GPR1 [Cephalotrichum gorgonifer]|uniref:Related to Y.lipolytica glyoxylate pathway regulator GPR1 n=1 Tax=Cephalotrichum gorgonifer TaxID=2041049 RepID=A0AAE8SV74_9PEZI|nr:related to Y.lipolytica glyoxylate pathway regulator GPR1 [Cephalotrichum gorgonifer]
MAENAVEKHENPNGSTATGHDGSVRHHDLSGPPEGFLIHPSQIRPYEHRKLANPAPLGLSAFALTTFVLSAINMHARDVVAPNVVIPLAFGYGGFVQLLAGMWEMAVGNTFGATALSSYGGFWIAYGLLFHPNFNVFNSQRVAGEELVLAYTAAERYSAVGFFLTGWFIFTTLLLLCTLRSTVMFFLLFFTLDLAFLFLACENYAGSLGNDAARVALQKTGGAFGILAAFLAWYNALAGIQDNSNSFFQVPVFPLPWSDKAIADRAAKASHSV